MPRRELSMPPEALLAILRVTAALRAAPERVYADAVTPLRILSAAMIRAMLRLLPLAQEMNRCRWLSFFDIVFCRLGCRCHA